MTAKLPTPFQADDLLQGQGFAVSGLTTDPTDLSCDGLKNCLAGATNLQVLQEAINMSLQLAQETSTVAEMDNDEI